MILMKGANMKYTFKYNDNLDVDEIIIEHNADSSIIENIHQYLNDHQKSYATLKLLKGDEQYYLKVSDILFFETESAVVYAHTKSDAYECEYRLYELEEKLPSEFIRVSKSSICNTKVVLAISRFLNASGTIRFINSHKEIYVSRKFYNDLKISLEKRNTL